VNIYTLQKGFIGLAPWSAILKARPEPIHTYGKKCYNLHWRHDLIVADVGRSESWYQCQLTFLLSPPLLQNKRTSLVFVLTLVQYLQVRTRHQRMPDFGKLFPNKRIFDLARTDRCFFAAVSASKKKVVHLNSSMLSKDLKQTTQRNWSLSPTITRYPDWY
jgi:hypothetical protein